MPKTNFSSKNILTEFELSPKEVISEKKESLPQAGTLEKKPEQQLEQIREVIQPPTSQASKGQEAVVAPAAVRQAKVKKLPYYREVEEILAAGLEEIYHKLPPVKQQEFKTTGEETAQQITQLLNSTKIKIFEFSKKVFNLIIGWLRIIPGVNRFFLEQEAKIKADQIIAIKQKPQ